MSLPIALSLSLSLPPPYMHMYICIYERVPVGTGSFLLDRWMQMLTYTTTLYIGESERNTHVQASLYRCVDSMALLTYVLRQRAAGELTPGMYLPMHESIHSSVSFFFCFPDDMTLLDQGLGCAMCFCMDVSLVVAGWSL